MRLLPVGFAIAIAAATMSSAGYGQGPSDQVDARSVALSRQAQTALTGGQTDNATDLFETALAVDPKNREAYVGLARVALAQRLPGKAIRFYADALQIEPNDVNALAGQGEAYVQRGAVDRARRNLARVQQLCGQRCPQAAQLEAVIQRGPPVTTAQGAQPQTPPATTPPRQPN